MEYLGTYSWIGAAVLLYELVDGLVYREKKEWIALYALPSSYFVDGFAIPRVG